MSEKYMETVRVAAQEELLPDIFSLWLETENIAAHAVPGQFVSVYCKDRSRMLPRPISLCEICPEDAGKIRLVYRTAGEGTREFSRLQKGDTLEILGPLGNGFPLEACAAGKKALLIGGGIGIPPLLELAKRIEGEARIVCGYRSSLFLQKELEKAGSFYAATEDGSSGTRGNVLDCIREKQLKADVIYACGPAPMLRAVKAFAHEEKIPCWISMEERMACGIGACLACVTPTREKDPHTCVHNARICKEGPVFSADQVEI